MNKNLFCKIFAIIIWCAVSITPCFCIEEEIRPDFIEQIFETPKTIKFEKGIINEITGEIRFKGTVAFEEIDDNKSAKYPFEIDTLLETKFLDDKYRFFADYSFTKEMPKEVDSQFFGKFSHLFVERKLNSKNILKIGSSRAPIGIEGSTSSYYLPLVRRAQIAKTIGNATATGVSIAGENNAFEYNIGGYTSTRYSQGFKDGADFIGKIGYQPFYKKNKVLKNFKLYTGSDIGHREKDYQNYFGALSYEYNKFLLNAEYSYANGYNGRQFSLNEAEGYFITTGWNITPKVQFLLRYDNFDKNKKIKNNQTTEYTAGINWFIFKERLKLALNYVYIDNKQKKDNYGIYFLTQLFI